MENHHLFYEKNRKIKKIIKVWLGPIFSQYGPEQAWLIRDLFNTQLKVFRKNATMPLGKAHSPDIKGADTHI